MHVLNVATTTIRIGVVFSQPTVTEANDVFQIAAFFFEKNGSRTSFIRRLSFISN